MAFSARFYRPRLSTGRSDPGLQSPRSVHQRHGSQDKGEIMLAQIDQERVVKTDVTCANGMPAFLARPNRPGPYPVIVVLHERYGLQDHQKDMCTRFAAEGIMAVAPSLFFREPDLEA